MSPAPNPPPAGAKPNSGGDATRRIGKYVIEKRIGAGGMGTVYLGMDEKLKRRVALKVLPVEKAENEILVRRFKAEAQAAAALVHENIVQVYESDFADGQYYIAMEYVDGTDAHEMVSRRGAFTVKRSIEIVKQLALALQCAFEHRIVHRDIKPSNVLIRRSDGMAKLTDLGLARSIDETLETDITRAGTTVGTVDYMSPEQARSSKAADIRSDLYSLGCTWYHMLTGKPPFPEDSLTNKLHAHAIKDPPDPRVLNPAVTEGVVAIIHRLMAKDPEDRYETPLDLIDDINQSRLQKGAFSADILDEGGAAGAAARKPPGMDSQRPNANNNRAADALADIEPVDRGFDDVADNDEVSGSGGGARGKSRNGRADASADDRDHPRGEGRVGSRTEGQGEGRAAGRAKGGRVDEEAETSATSRGKSRGPRGTLPPRRQAELEPSKLSFQFDVRWLMVPAGCLLLGAAIYGLKVMSDSWGKAIDIAAPVARNPEAPVPEPPAPALPLPEPAKPKGDEPVVVRTPPRAQSDLPSRIDPFQLPSWVKETVDTAGLAEYYVGRAAPGRKTFDSLAAALKAASGRGGVIELVGAGVFPVSPVSVASAGRIVIRGRGPQLPVIRLMNRPGSSEFGLAFRDTAIEFENVHFLAQPTPGNVASDAAMIRLSGGSLMLRQCSLTTTGVEALAAIALGTGAEQVRAQLHNVAIRGSRLAGMSLDAPLAEVLVRESLLATGQSPAMVLRGSQKNPAQPDELRQPKRRLQFVRSTLAGANTVLDVAVSPTGGHPPATLFAFSDSVLAAGPGTGQKWLAELAHWPQDAAAVGQSRFTNLEWVSQRTAYVGFSELAHLAESSGLRVAESEMWRRVWNHPFDPAHFLDVAWLPAETEAGLTPLAAFSPTSPAASAVFETLGFTPGCEPTSLPELSGGASFSRTARPTLPQSILEEAESVRPIVKVDLAKEDLGAVIGRNQWESGTEFHVTGAGIKSVGPIRVERKSLKIVGFDSSDKDAAPLVLQVRPTDYKAGDDTAWMTVDHGELILERLTLAGPTTPRTATPRWLIAAHNSRLQMESCELRAPAAEPPGPMGAIRVTSTGAKLDALPHTVIRNSFVHGVGPLLRWEAAQGPLHVHQSLLVSRGDAIELAPRTSELLPETMLDLQFCTLSATRAALSAQLSMDATQRSPLPLWVTGCVFAPPLGLRVEDTSQACAVQTRGMGDLKSVFEWRGLENGYSSELNQWLRPGSGGGQSAEAGWDAAWGGDADRRRTAGDRAVLLKEALPSKFVGLAPDAYLLKETCTAATWSDGGLPIGAPVTELKLRVGRLRTPAGSVPTKPMPKPADKTKPSDKPKPKTSSTSPF